MDSKKVSDLIAQALADSGVKHIFGMIGAGNVHLFDSISNLGLTEIVCIHHEQAATMAMQTYYRTHGKIAACLLTTGAGASNGVTGVLSAWADSIPGLVISGNENAKYIDDSLGLRMYGVQGFDAISMVEKITKYAKRIQKPECVVYEIKKALDLSVTGRPGPCWIELPMDLQAQRINPNSIVDYIPDNSEIFNTPLIDSQIQDVVESFSAADRPILWLGNGIRLAKAESKLDSLLEALKIPALVSWAGIDMIDSDHPLIYGRAGVYGQRCANFILQNSDYILAIGTRLAIPQVGYDLSELARMAVIDVVDIDPSEATKYRNRTRQSIVSDAGKFIDKLLLQAGKKPIEFKNAWVERCNQYKSDYPWIAREHDDKNGYINSYRFIERLNQHFKVDQVVVTDMGTALLCAHQALKIKSGQRLMTSTGLGEMGYGLPAAIGASFATNRGEVMCLNCDGGMMLNLQELQTIVHHQLPIKIFIFNNDGYLMIKHTQNALFKNGHVATDKDSGVSCPDFEKIGLSFGIPTYQIRSWEGCDETLSAVQSEKGSAICEVFMDPTQLFSPKLSLASRADGSLVSPPLEDLSPLLPRDVLGREMIIGMHEKSRML
jgi:acetolactate synthase-1/2/3 large subunit